MNKHTPTPWTVQQSDHVGGLLIKPVPGQVVAQCDEGSEMEANAAFIVRAVNAHDDLVAALKNCAPYYAVMGEATIFAIEAALKKAEPT